MNNACATLAVLNALGNIPSLESGQQLSDLFSFSAGMDAQTRGLVITSSDWLREAHNALSPPSAISLDGLGLPKKQAEDAYHFVVYLPAMGSVYELDGLREHPVSHGAYETSGEGWLKKARETIEHRIATYPPGSVRHLYLLCKRWCFKATNIIIARLQSTGCAGRSVTFAASSIDCRNWRSN